MGILVSASCLLLAFLTGTASAQDRAQDLLNPAQPFYSDLAGHHALGTATAPTQEEAERLAKAAALQRCFQETGKDELFQQLFISSWPDAISIEASRMEKAKEGGMTAVLRVRIDRNAMIMTEAQYRNAAADLLNRSEKLVAELEKALSDAAADETNLRIPQALTGYSNARSRLREIGVLLKSLGDESQTSDTGRSLAATRKTVKALEERVSAGMDRIESIERKTAKDAATEELASTLDLMSAEMEKVAAATAEYDGLSPFYDMPRARLESILIELKKNLEKTRLLAEKLAFLKGKVPAERVLVEQKVRLAVADVTELDSKLRKQKDAAELELREPRLARQENARRWSEIGKGAAAALSYAFLHKPADVLSFRYEIPFAWDGEHAVAFNGERDFRIRAEGAFPFGFWIRGVLANAETALAPVTAAAYPVNQALYSEAAIGYFRGLLIAAGFGWDWTRTVYPADPAAAQKTAKENFVRVLFGGANQEGTRIDWLLSLQYRLPLFGSPFLVPYHFNAALDLMARVADILILDAGVSTGCLQRTAQENASLIVPTNLSYAFSWHASIAVRVPGPFAWGLVHQGEWIAPLLDGLGTIGAGSGYAGEWGLFVEYDF